MGHNAAVLAPTPTPGLARGARAVRMASATRMALATVLCLGVHGCEAVNGGAVELSWKLRPASGDIEDKFVSCDVGDPDVPGPQRVTHIRLDWEVGGQSGQDRWECEENHGVTGFDLPQGLALLSVTPECAEGRAASESSYIAPAAEQRRVIVGDTVGLGAVELVVVVANCNGNCICE